MLAGEVAPASGRRPNERLDDLMREANLSAKALARALREAGAARGKQVRCDHTSVSRWLAGVHPRAATARLLCEVLGRRLGRIVSPADAGLVVDALGETTGGVNDLAEMFARLADSSTSDAAIDRLSHATFALAESHARAPARSVLDQVLRLHGQARALLGGRLRLSQRRNLYLIESDLLAHSCLLLGDLKSDDLADRYGAVALRYAEEAGSNEALACTALAKTFRWQNRLIESAEIARRGYERSPATPIRVQLAAQEANAAALFGDVGRAREAMSRAERDAETVTQDSGLSAWSFARGRQAVFALSVANQTGDPAGALRAAAIADAGWANGEPRVPANWAQVRVGAAMAHLALGSLDAALAEVAPVLTLQPEMRIATVTAYTDALDRQLGGQRYRDSEPAKELRQKIRDFNAGALPGELPKAGNA
jgi:hypothetical protein